MYDKIKNIIISKKSDIDNKTLKYYTNYFYVLAERNIIPEKIKIEDLIDNALYYAQEIVFYDEDTDLYKKLGPDIKGLRDPKTRKLYVRNNLEEPLREMIVYHELHHAVQTNRDNNEVGINQTSNIGRMIMEAQTQWFAEEVYKTIHNVNFEEREIPSEELRMLENGTVVSALHNYEMYDAILSKLAILLDVPKDFFVSINFLYDRDKGLDLLEEKYLKKREEKKIDLEFDQLLYAIDYIYVVDLMAYLEGEDKDIILSGKETDNVYCIYPTKGSKLSLSNQRKYMNYIDLVIVDSLQKSGYDTEKFSKYIIDNEFRKKYYDDKGTKKDNALK